MINYEKPALEVIELRPEERLAYTCVASNGSYKFTIDDEDWTDGNTVLEAVQGWKKKTDGSKFKFAFWDISMSDFKKFLGF
jgi:hypothetical protein